MMMKRIGYILRFWRDTASVFGTAVSAGLVYAYSRVAESGGTGSMLPALLAGRIIVSALIVYMLSQSRRMRELDYYNNLGVGPCFMLWGVAAVDCAVFIAMLAAAVWIG